MQTPNYQSEEDVVLVSATDYVRLSNIGGGSESIKLHTTDLTHYLPKLIREIVVVNSGTYVDRGRLGVVANMEQTATDSNKLLCMTPIQLLRNCKNVKIYKIAILMP